MSHLSKLKINKLLIELIDNGFIIHFQNKRGKYAITELGFKALYLMRKGNV